MRSDGPVDAPPPTIAHPVRNPELDWLRAYAVLLVMVLHLARILGPDPGRFRAVFDALDFSGGVDLFFAISGFVIAGSLEPLWSLPRPRCERHPRTRAIVRTFFVRRFWRLWPASTLWITYCLAVSWISQGRGGWPPVGHVAREWVTAVVPVYELREFRSPGVLGYYWTLSVEWQFYAVFPFLLIGFRSARARMAVLALLFGLGLYTNEISWMLRFSSIVAGIGIYATYRSGRLAVASGRVPPLRPWPRFLLTASLLVTLVTVPQRAGSMLIGQLGLVLLCTILVTMAAADRELVSDCGVPRLMGWIGLRSYSLYLCHIPVALTLSALLDRFGRPGDGTVRVQLEAVGLALAITLVLADLSYRHVELPLQRRYRPRPGW